MSVEHDANSPSGGTNRTSSRGGGSSQHVSLGSPGNDELTVISKRRPTPVSPLPLPTRPAEIGASLAGHRLGHFQLEEFIGGGGMGAVFRAIDTTLGRTVALKVVSNENADEETLRRFRNEAQSAARLDHPNIARVYFVGADQGWNYIVFEYIEGVNIRDLVEHKGPLSVEEAISYTLQVADALEHANQRDVVHRDIKPSNILVMPDGRAKLVDMGLARLHHVDSPSNDLTATGVTLGTFDYISPEQARDPRSADVRSDLYSLGCTLYFMLTGSPPFPEGTVLQKLLNHSSEQPPDPRELRPALQDELVAITLKLMSKQPSQRYQRPQLLATDLLVLAHQLGLSGVARSDVSSRPWSDTSSWRLRYHLPWLVPLLLFPLGLIGLEWLWQAEGLPESAPQRPRLADAAVSDPSSLFAPRSISEGVGAVDTQPPRAVEMASSAGIPASNDSQAGGALPLRSPDNRASDKATSPETDQGRATRPQQGRSNNDKDAPGNGFLPNSTQPSTSMPERQGGAIKVADSASPNGASSVIGPLPTVAPPAMSASGIHAAASGSQLATSLDGSRSGAMTAAGDSSGTVSKTASPVGNSKTSGPTSATSTSPPSGQNGGKGGDAAELRSPPLSTTGSPSPPLSNDAAAASRSRTVSLPVGSLSPESGKPGVSSGISGSGGVTAAVPAGQGGMGPNGSGLAVSPEVGSPEAGGRGAAATILAGMPTMPAASPPISGSASGRTAESVAPSSVAEQAVVSRVVVGNPMEFSTPGVIVVGTLRAALRKAVELPSVEAIELAFQQQKESPLELNLNRKLTIRAAAGYQPILILEPDANEIALEKPLFKFTGGRITMEGIHFRVDSAYGPIEGGSLFRLDRVDGLRLVDCTLTFHSDFEATAAFFSVEGAREPMAMADPLAQPVAPIAPPQITLVRSVVRGRATLVRAVEGLPVWLDWEQGLFSSTQPLVELGGLKQSAETRTSFVRLRQVTVSTLQSLYLVEVDDVRPIPPELSIRSEHGVFAVSAPLIEHRGVQSADQVENRLSRVGEHNFYAGHAVLWRIVPADTEPVEYRWQDQERLQAASDTLSETLFGETMSDRFIRWAQPVESRSPLVYEHTPQQFLLDELQQNRAGFDPAQLPVPRVPALPEVPQP